MRSFIVKFIMTLAILWVVLGWFFGVSFTNILITTIAVSIVGYIADLFILPRANNTVATIVDLVVTYAVVWIVGANAYAAPVALNAAAITSAIVIGIGEMFFHRYMANVINSDGGERDRDRGYYNRTDLQTEFGEESDVEEEVRKSKENRDGEIR